MDVEIPDDLQRRLAGIDRLSRWERSEMGRDLRRLGLSYGEIQEWMDVPKSTLSNWCRAIPLSEAQKQGILERTGSRKGVPTDSQWRRRKEIMGIRAAARAEIVDLASNPLWLAGTMLYWGEGSKTSNRLALSNSDPALHRIFLRWVPAFVLESPEFVLSLNLHHDNDELAAKDYWRGTLGLADAAFYKSFLKPEGTGHRKNTLPFGVCQTRVRASSDGLHRVMGWIDGLKAFDGFF